MWICCIVIFGARESFVICIPHYNEIRFGNNPNITATIIMSVFHLCRFSFLFLHLSSDEAVKHRLEQVDHQLNFSFLLVACQVDHFVLVACHQTFVAYGGFLVKFIGTGERMRTVTQNFDRCVLCVCAYRERLTVREYMALIFSLNCIVAVTKMASVAESCFPLERKSLTYREIQDLGIWVNKSRLFGII